MGNRRLLISEAAKEQIYGRKINPPWIGLEECQGCGLCVRSCPACVFDLRDGKSVVARDQACIGCGHCWAVCPEEAVVLGETSGPAKSQPGPGPAVVPDDLHLLLRERRSVRLFTKEPVAREQLEKILDAGRYAPTACNLQGVNYIALPSREKMGQLRTLVDGFFDRLFREIDNNMIALLYAIRFGRANLNVVRSYSSLFQSLRQGQEDQSYVFLPYGTAAIVAHAPSSDVMAPFNCAVALQNCSLMAHSLELGACFLGCLHLAVNADKRIKRWLGIPRKHRCQGAMVVGHPDLVFRRLPERQPPRVQWL